MAEGARMVVFDWGGVVLRICRSWREGCERAGLVYEPGLDTPEIASARHAIARRYEIGSIDADEFLGSIAGAMHDRYSTEEIRCVHRAWLIEEYAGMPELIEELAGVPGVGTGLLSNTNHLHWIEHLRRDEGGTGAFPAVRMLTHRHASHLLGLAKPDPAIFSLFERQTGFSGESILFFDDLDANVAAARSAGWEAVQVDHAGDTASQIRRELAARGLLGG